MHQTMIMPIAVLGVTALSALFIKNTKPGGRPTEAQTAAKQTATDAPPEAEPSQAPAA
jgi:hypothetical protein